MSKLILLTRSTLGLVLWSRRLLFDKRTRSTNASHWLALPGVLALIGLQFGYIDSAVAASNEITCSAPQHGKTIALGQAKLFFELRSGYSQRVGVKRLLTLSSRLLNNLRGHHPREAEVKLD